MKTKREIVDKAMDLAYDFADARETFNMCNDPDQASDALRERNKASLALIQFLNEHIAEPAGQIVPAGDSTVEAIRGMK